MPICLRLLHERGCDEAVAGVHGCSHGPVFGPYKPALVISTTQPDKRGNRAPPCLQHSEREIRSAWSAGGP